MLKKIVMFIIGINICSISLMFIIIYLNLLRMNYNFIDYIKYIFTHFECLMFIIGLILIKFSLKKSIKRNI
jgi:hypothetical protein